MIVFHTLYLFPRQYFCLDVESCDKKIAPSVWCSWRQSRNRPPARVIAAPDFGKRFLTVVAALDRFLLLVRGELRRPAHFHALRLGARPAFARACADQVALELGQTAQDGEHQATVRRRRVRPCVGEGTETGSGLRNPVERVQKIARRSRGATARGRSSRRSPSRGKSSRLRRRAKPSPERQSSGRRSKRGHSRKSCGEGAEAPKLLQQTFAPLNSLIFEGWAIVA